ncbi:MAG: hypothetical protein ABFD79_17250 [Phycisphaerales bacterium]
MQHILHFVIALVICWLGYAFFYPNHNILMVLFIVGLFLLLDVLKTYLNKGHQEQKNMLLTSFCLVGATMSILSFIPNLFEKPFFLIPGSLIGFVASFPVIWGICKKAKQSEFYLREWKIDWASIQVVVLGTLFTMVTIISTILIIIGIEMRNGCLIDITAIVLAGTSTFFVCNYIIAKIAEYYYKKKFYIL